MTTTTTSKNSRIFVASPVSPFHHTHLKKILNVSESNWRFWVKSKWRKNFFINRRFLFTFRSDPYNNNKQIVWILLYVTKIQHFLSASFQLKNMHLTAVAAADIIWIWACDWEESVPRRLYGIFITINNELNDDVDNVRCKCTSFRNHKKFLISNETAG